MSSDEDHLTDTTRITRKGQVTIPKQLREEYGLSEGDELRWQRDDDGIKVRKATSSSGRGMLVDDGVPEAKREEMATELEATIREKRSTEWHAE